MVRYIVKKYYLRPLYVPSECGKCRFRDPKFMNPGARPSGPPTEMCCHFTVRVHGPLPA